MTGMEAKPIQNDSQELHFAQAVAARMIADYESGDLTAEKAARLAKRAWNDALANVKNWR